MKKIVAIGGGTGLSNLLAGLKTYTNRLSGVVTMTDDGYSSGRLRQEFDILPPGDIRQCLTALASDESLMTRVFQYRFEKGKGISGHSLGNLLLIALENITGSFSEAINQAGHILAIKGEVFPSALKQVSLKACLQNGKVVIGEKNMAREGHRSPIKRVYLQPSRAKANPDVIWAVNSADVILIGPGSLYTSIIPNLLIKDLTKAIVRAKSKKIFVCNISTERGETEEYTVEAHIGALIKHSHPKVFDIVLVNDNIIATNHDKGRFGNVTNITTDKKKIGRYRIVSHNLVNPQKPLFHDREKLAKAIMEI